MNISSSFTSFSSRWRDRPVINNLSRTTHVYGAVPKEERVVSGSRVVHLEDDAELRSSNSTNRRLLKACILICAITILIVELIFLITSNNSALPNTATDTHEILKPYEFKNISNYAGCGNSQENALARGCKFDRLTISWETPECYHADIVDDFLSVQDWKYYNDSRGSPVPPGASTTDGARRWNVNWDFHFTHCVYAWKMMQKAVFERRPLPDNLLDLEHTRHCMGVLLDKRFSWDSKSTLVHVKWPKCASFEQWDTAKWIENLVLPDELK